MWVNNFPIEFYNVNFYCNLDRCKKIIHCNHRPISKSKYSNILIRSFCHVLKGFPSTKVINCWPRNSRPSVIKLPIQSTIWFRFGSPLRSKSYLNCKSLKYTTKINLILEILWFIHVAIHIASKSIELTVMPLMSQ